MKLCISMPDGSAGRVIMVVRTLSGKFIARGSS